MPEIKVALVGQPNVGKSTLFNVLTQGNVIVTNWPGTTVERHVGLVKYRGLTLHVIDLPGTYGLTYSTLEEKITRDYILREKPNVIVVLVDSLAIERTMYIALELMELTDRIVIALTKTDAAHGKGIHINFEALEKALGVPIVPVSAAKSYGLATLIDKVIEVYSKSKIDVFQPALYVDYGELEYFIDEMSSILQERLPGTGLPARWIAIKFLEGDRDVREMVRSLSELAFKELIELENEARRRLGENIQVHISKRRFEFIEDITRNAVSRVRLSSRTQDKLTRVFYNPFIAPFVSLLIILGVFVAVFTVNTGYPLTTMLEMMGYVELSSIVSEYSLNSILERAFDTFSSMIYSHLGETPLSKFIIEGVLGGIFSLLVFIPLLIVVFVALGALEDSGLAPRLSIGLHSLFQRIGLSGHSIFPLTLSTGCNVPGILATRSIPNLTERLKLIVLLPFVPCQARLIVLLAFATSIGGLAGMMLIPLAYLISFLVIGILSFLSWIRERRTGASVELLLELPPIHKPILRVVWWYTWFHLKHFLIKAGTLIVLANIMAWTLTHLTGSLVYTDNPAESIAFTLSRLISPVLRPMGLEGYVSWIVMFAILMGLIAKEVFLTSLVAITGEATPYEALRALSIPLPSAVAISLFVTLYIPCIATIASIYSETRSVRTALKAVILMIVIAYVISILGYMIASSILL